MTEHRHTLVNRVTYCLSSQHALPYVLHFVLGEALEKKWGYFFLQNNSIYVTRRLLCNFRKVLHSNTCPYLLDASSDILNQADFLLCVQPQLQQSIGMVKMSNVALRLFAS
jgi:hypothetical protein